MKFSLKKKTALLVTIIALTIAVVAAAVSYRLYAGTMDTRYKNSALDIARTAALSDSDAVARYADAVLAIYRQDPAPEWTDAAELSVATQIQADMLPSIFPAFPNHPEFDIYATMTPAKEVGGDFYDFFLVDEDHLCLVMADVSGKGVPAALFMVIAKTLLKNSAQTGMNPARILETVNNQLCEGNQAEMFVTTWLGILQLSTGRLVAANAGHEYPVCRRAGGDFALVKDRHGFVLAGMEGSRYREYTLDLAPGDRLFLYTDGVTEATDEHQQLYGTRRLLDALNRSRDADPRTLLQAVQADIHAFVGAADPFDDITMLALEIKGMAHHYRLELAPTLEELPRATAFVEESLQKEQVPPPLVYKFNVVMDELFSNIARYSGATRAAVVCFVQDGKVTLRFEDDGKPFDPLAAAEPDTTLSAEERNIGGLGVFLVKRMMDEMHYERRQEKNCLTLSLHLPGSPGRNANNAPDKALPARDKIFRTAAGQGTLRAALQSVKQAKPGPRRDPALHFRQGRVIRAVCGSCHSSRGPGCPKAATRSAPCRPWC